MAFGRVLSLRLRVAVIGWALLAGLVVAIPSTATARQDTRTLKLHFTHTGERGVFTFRRNGQYDRKELDRINYILRDWRRNEPTRMDPALLDLIWEIYRRTGSNDYVYIISAYRSPATNEALRKRSSGVAKQSQHTRGKAMDFFIPGVSLSKLRAIALTMQQGGVGYYPGSGSPFVHVDTGGVRHWPRMTRQQLASLFPNGETLHVPSDGKPLPGYERAVAKYKSGQAIAVASAAGAGSGQANMSSWLKRVFSRGADESEDDAMAGQRPVAPAPATAVARAPDVQPEAPATAPAPRPAGAVNVALAEGVQQVETPTAPLPKAVPEKSRLIMMAARERAQLAQMAEAATALPAPPAGSPQHRPADPVTVAAIAEPTANPPINATSADAALAGLFAAAEGGNPEAGPTLLLTAAAVQEELADSPAAEGPGQPADGVDFAVLDGAGVAGSRQTQPSSSGKATAAVDALSMFGRGNGEGASVGPKVELAYAPASEEADRRAADRTRGAITSQTERGMVGSDAAAERGEDRLRTQPPAPAAPVLALRLDAPLLQRLISHETTRTAAFGVLARPQPRRDLYAVPASSGDILKMARLGHPRTDRFQQR